MFSRSGCFQVNSKTFAKRLPAISNKSFKPTSGPDFTLFYYFYCGRQQNRTRRLATCSEPICVFAVIIITSSMFDHQFCCNNAFNVANIFLSREPKFYSVNHKLTINLRLMIGSFFIHYAEKIAFCAKKKKFFAMKI